MSRIGKSPVEVPGGVEVSIADDILTAKGKNGALTVALHEAVEVKQEDGKIVVNPREGAPAGHKMWGTMRSMINNAVVGASEGFTVRLEINGVGYRAGRGDLMGRLFCFWATVVAVFMRRPAHKWRGGESRSIPAGKFL